MFFYAEAIKNFTMPQEKVQDMFRLNLTLRNIIIVPTDLNYIVNYKFVSLQSYDECIL